MHSLTFVLIFCTLISRTTGAQVFKQATIPIKYHCEAAALEYNLARLLPHYENFSYSIAESLKTLPELHGTTEGDCFQPFQTISAATGDKSLKCSQLTAAATGKTLVLYLMKSSIDTEQLVGGVSFVESDLPCDVSDKTEIKVDNTDLKKLDGTKQPPPIPDLLDMSVKHTGSALGPPFFIGDLLYAEISVILGHTATDHFLALETCSARSGKQGSTKSVNLYDFAHPENAPLGTDILSTPVNATNSKSNGPISFPFFAFRFDDSDSVVLQCQVNVCKTTLACPQAKRRRRRSANDEYNAASVTFVVHDKDKEVKSGQQKNLPMLTVISFGLMLLYTMFQ